MNGAVFTATYVGTLATVGVALGLIFILKLYYTIITVKDFIDARKKEGASELDVSDVVNLSVKDN